MTIYGKRYRILKFILHGSYQENYKLLTSNTFHKWLLVSINALPQFGKDKYLGIAMGTISGTEYTESTLDLSEILDEQ